MALGKTRAAECAQKALDAGQGCHRWGTHRVISFDVKELSRPPANKSLVSLNLPIDLILKFICDPWTSENPSAIAALQLIEKNSR